MKNHQITTPGIAARAVFSADARGNAPARFGLIHALRFTVCIACLSLLPDAIAQEVTVSNPAGGWVRESLAGESAAPAIAYPQGPIDRGRQKARTLIEGRLKQSTVPGKDGNIRGAPYTLIVNGNAMPLYTGADGQFARPYVFGRGSNSIEIKSPGGVSKKRIQFYEASNSKPQAQLRIILGWDDDQAEVDLHVVTPDGQHAYFANPVLANGGGMDVDSVDGAGPEMFSITQPLKGQYHVWVNYWGNFTPAGYHFDEASRKRVVITTTVTLVFNENTPHEKRELFVVPLRRIGDLNHVKSFVF